MYADIAEGVDVNKKMKVADLLNNYVVNNPISVISAVGSLLGGLLILVYLVSIPFFPSDMNVSMVGLLLAGSAIAGIFLTTLLAIYFVLPGFIYRHVLNAKSVELSQGTQEATQINLLSNSAIIWLVDVPSLIVFVIAIVVVLFKPSDFQWIYLLAALPIFLLLLYGKFCEENKKIISQFIGIFNRLKLIKWEWTYFFMSGLMAFLPWFFILLLIANYEKVAADEDLVWFVFVEMCVVALLANHVVATIKDWWLLAIVAPVVLFLLLALTEQISLIPKVVIRTLALGNIPNATLLLDEQGCQIASQYVRAPQDLADIIKSVSSISKEGKKNHDEKNEPSMVCRLSPVNLKWRIGNEYFVDATDAKLYPVIGKKSADEDKKIKNGNSLKQVEQVSVNPQSVSVELPLLPASGFTIASAHVLSWSMAEQKKPVTQ